jgi:hypothetical protein
MNFWETFWQIVLVISVVGFAVLAVVVTFGGLSDIRAMLRSIESRHDETARKQDPRPTNDDEGT